MRKLNFLVGAVSGLFGGLLLSNKKLRSKLKKAEDAGDAARILGEEMKKSGKEIAKETKKWVQSDEAKSWWKKMKFDCKDHLPDVTKKAKKAIKKAKKAWR